MKLSQHNMQKFSSFSLLLKIKNKIFYFIFFHILSSISENEPVYQDKHSSYKN